MAIILLGMKEEDRKWRKSAIDSVSGNWLWCEYYS